jgi:hypothetical protein
MGPKPTFPLKLPKSALRSFTRRQRDTDHPRQPGFSIRLWQQQHAGVEPAVMGDDILGIAHVAGAKSDARKKQFIEMFQGRRDGRPLAPKISFAPSGKSVALFRASRAHQEGRFAIVTDVGRGMRWMREAPQDERRKRGRRNRVVLILRRWDQVLCDLRRATVAN